MAIPAELRSREQWVVWRAERRAGKITKVPYQAENPGRKASVTNSRTWASYAAAAEAAQQYDNISGIGFVFTDDDPFCGVDFDKAMDGGKINAEVLSKIEQLSTYTERSPSGKGFHCIGRGEVKGTRHRANGIEVYDRERFFCMTGKRLRGTPVKLKQINVDWLLSENGNGHAKDDTQSQRVQKKQGERHPALVALGAQLLARGAPRDVVEEALRSLADEIKLPSRERDEVGRIVEWLFQTTSLDNRIARDAEQRWVKHQGGLIFQERLSESEPLENDLFNAAEELKIPDEEQTYVIDQLMPDGANVLLSAERKLGKTRMALTITKALVDGSPFLNYFDVDAPDGSVLYINYELSRLMFRRWMREANFQRPERLHVLHKSAGNFHFWLPHVREEIVGLCRQHDVWCLIIDPQLMAMVGAVQNENDNIEVAGWQQAVMAIKQEAEIENCIVLHHIGKVDPERGRGASQIEAWPDVLWYMQSEDDGTRVFSSKGRDVQLNPIALGYDKDTETYFWDGETQVEDRKIAALVSWVQTLLAMHETDGAWPTKSIARKALTVKSALKTETMTSAIAQGLVRETGSQPIRLEVTEAGRGLAGR